MSYLFDRLLWDEWDGPGAPAGASAIRLRLALQGRVRPTQVAQRALGGMRLTERSQRSQFPHLVALTWINAAIRSFIQRIGL